MLHKYKVLPTAGAELVSAALDTPTKSCVRFCAYQAAPNHICSIHWLNSVYCEHRSKVLVPSGSLK
jgi:hypothetical protein